MYDNVALDERGGERWREDERKDRKEERRRGEESQLVCLSIEIRERSEIKIK